MLDILVLSIKDYSRWKLLQMSEEQDLQFEENETITLQENAFSSHSRIFQEYSVWKIV